MASRAEVLGGGRGDRGLGGEVAAVEDGLDLHGEDVALHLDDEVRAQVLAAADAVGVGRGLDLGGELLDHAEAAALEGLDVVGHGLVVDRLRDAHAHAELPRLFDQRGGGLRSVVGG